MPRYKLTAMIEEEDGLRKAHNGPYDSLSGAVKELKRFEQEKQGATAFLNSADIKRIEQRGLNE